MTTMGLDDVLAWLRSLGAVDAASWTMARLDAGKQRCVGVWQRPGSYGREVALGGEACTLTRTKHVQVLLHWTRDARETERAAQALYDALAASGGARIGGYVAPYLELEEPEPVDVGADESGVFERVIRLIIHYREER